jgi:transcriptional regulator with XRE-family HTH domain
MLSVTLPDSTGGSTLWGVSDIARLPEALRRLRKKSRLPQQQIEARAGLGASSLSRYERGDERPSLTTLWKLLDALGADLHDLAIELDEEPEASRRPGRPRPEWVSDLAVLGLGREATRGFAFGVVRSSDAAAEQDFVASAQEAAAAIARQALDEARSTYADLPQVAEPKPSRYATDGVQKSGTRKPSPR